MNSDFPQTCPQCGKPLPAGGGHRLCPACLLAQALASGTAFAGGAKPGAEPPPPPETIADKFPQFEILECLGRGGMGAVYKARQKSLNRTVAIKILAPEREHDARFAARFAREAELLARLSHPHIVTIHDFGQADGLFYIVMEFVDGVNLRDLLREGKVEPRQALAIVPPVCEALQYAHDHGVVHRDIKPENLLLDREGRVKIADFGIASLVGAEGEGAGTPPYMAPEQGAARPAADHRADIYALGVVLYEMLTGERPGREIVAPSRKVQIDVRLDEIVLRALEKQPEARYASATEFRTRVETVAGDGRPGAPLPARPPQGEARAWKPYLHTGLWLLPLLSAWYAAAIFVLPKLNEVEPGRTGYSLGPLLARMSEWSGPVLLSLGALVVLAEVGWPRWRRQRERALAGLAFGLGLGALAGLCLMILQGGLGVSVLKRANDVRAAPPRPGAAGPERVGVEPHGGTQAVARATISFGGVEWRPLRTLFEVRDGSLVSLPVVRPGFNYGHWGQGRGAEVVTNIGNPDWRDYRIDAQLRVPGVDPAFNPHGLGLDFHGAMILFHVTDRKENWNERGLSGYVLGFEGDGNWSLAAHYNNYCRMPLGWGDWGGDGERKLASGSDAKLDREKGNRLRLQLRGKRIQVWLDDRKLVDLVDEQMDRPIGGQTLDHGGVAFVGGFDAMIRLEEFSLTKLGGTPAASGL